jgi:8-amino-7-oxononanoate synthase
MNFFEHELNQQLGQIREQGLFRELRRIDSPQGPRIEAGGQSLLNFSSNDYLGLASEPALRDAAVNALEQFGIGSGASRLICGSLAPHHELEQSLARFKGTESALVFSSGYATAVGTITALLDKDDVIILDKLVHASIVDAARLSGAKLRVYPHNDLDELASILQWADRRHREKTSIRRPRVLIVTESVFSMDGDLAALGGLVELKEKHGAWLMLDEAHATGLFGQNRRGLAEAFELADRVEIQMGTLGKALGVAGGYICGSRSLTELLVNRARSFIFSTAPMPAAAAAAGSAVALVRSPLGEERRVRLWSMVDELKNGLIRTGWPLRTVQSPILPIIIGDEAQAMQLSARLRERGLFVPAIRYPTVGRGEARLRLTVTAAHTPVDVSEAISALADCRSDFPSA